MNLNRWFIENYKETTTPPRLQRINVSLKDINLGELVKNSVCRPPHDMSWVYTKEVDNEIEVIMNNIKTTSQALIDKYLNLTIKDTDHGVITYE